jgi:hypothetical protein
MRACRSRTRASRPPTLSTTDVDGGQKQQHHLYDTPRSKILGFVSSMYDMGPQGMRSVCVIGHENNLVQD